jgi:ATP synthase protein I
MFRVVAAQLVASLVVAGGAWLIGGHRAAVSSLLGGAACALPNGLFALNLAWLGHQPQSRTVSGRSGSATAHAVALLVGEFVKVVLTIGLLALIAWTYKDVVWLALIVAVIAVLWMQAVMLAWR